MAKKKVWTFESICRAARRRGKWSETYAGKVRCVEGYCPMGRVFTYGDIRTPWSHKKLNAKVGERTFMRVMYAADDRHDKNRPRMLKLLGIKA